MKGQDWYQEEGAGKVEDVLAGDGVSGATWCTVLSVQYMLVMFQVLFLASLVLQEEGSILQNCVGGETNITTVPTKCYQESEV